MLYSCYAQASDRGILLDIRISDNKICMIKTANAKDELGYTLNSESLVLSIISSRLKLCHELLEYMQEVPSFFLVRPSSVAHFVSRCHFAQPW